MEWKVWVSSKEAMCLTRRLTRREAEFLAEEIRERSVVLGSERTVLAERRIEMRSERRGMDSEVQERKMWVRRESGQVEGEE